MLILKMLNLFCDVNFLDFKMCVYIVYNIEFLFKLVVMYVFRHYKI